jgi:hypothetical protein
LPLGPTFRQERSRALTAAVAIDPTRFAEADASARSLVCCPIGDRSISAGARDPAYMSPAEQFLSAFRAGLVQRACVLNPHLFGSSPAKGSSNVRDGTAQRAE